MTKEASDIYAFGNQLPYKATHLHWTEGNLQPDEITLPRSGISHARYRLALSDINETWDIVADEETGKTFEVAVANLGGVATKGMDLEISTFSSSLSGNIGNAVELAMNSVAAGRPRMYVASFGNGGSSYLDRNERRYVRATGRFTSMGGDALPTIQALARVIGRQDHKVTRISTNSAGGAHATALMAALPKEQITDAYLKSRPNICDHAELALEWAAKLTLIDKLDNLKYNEVSEDPWRLTGALKAEAHAALPRLRSQEAGEKLADVERVNALVKAWTDMRTFSRGGYSDHFPAVYDTLAALRRQPEARIMHHIPTQDPHYHNPYADIPSFLEKIHALKPHYLTDPEAVIIRGRHTDHPFYPGLRWAAEKFAFSGAA